MSKAVLKSSTQLTTFSNELSKVNPVKFNGTVLKLKLLQSCLFITYQSQTKQNHSALGVQLT